MLAVERLAVAFDAACRETGVEYALIGGMAVITWGQPRFTADVDTLLKLEKGAQRSFEAALRAHGLSVSPGEFELAQHDGAHVSIFDESSDYHIDVKLARTPEEYQQIKSAKTIDLGENRQLQVAAPEETVAYKLAFGSPQDLQDARSIVIRQGERLDRARTREVAKRLGVAAALDALFAENP